MLLKLWHQESFCSIRSSHFADEWERIVLNTVSSKEPSVGAPLVPFFKKLGECNIKTLVADCKLFNSSQGSKMLSCWQIDATFLAKMVSHLVSIGYMNPPQM